MQAVGRRNHCRLSAKLCVLSYSTVTGLEFSIEFGITGYYDPGQLPRTGSQDTESPHYPVMCPLPLSVTLCDRIHQCHRQADTDI